MSVIPADQIIDMQAGGRRHVQSVGLATLRQYARRYVGTGKRFDGIADRVNCWLRSVESFADSFGLIRRGLLDFGQDNVGDHTLPAHAIEQTKEPPHYLFPIARLPHTLVSR